MNKRTKDFIVSIAMLGGFTLVFVVFIFAFTSNPKTMATADSVWSVLENKGYTPMDSTQEYIDKWNSTAKKVTKVITMQDGDVHFNFFVFPDNETTQQVRREYMSYIQTNRYGVPHIEFSEGQSNYMIYTLIAKGSENAYHCRNYSLRHSNSICFS